jgi:thiamine-monophosphate kinase
MDISDGLLKDLGRMMRASGTAAILHSGSLPLSLAARRLLEAEPGQLPAIVSGGDDYEILAAVSPHDVAAFVAAAAHAGVALTDIGEVAAGAGVTLLDPQGCTILPASDGYDHF